MQTGPDSDLSKMPPRKMSLSMRRAMVLNKGEKDELQRRVSYLRKSRDETLMELKAERLRLQIKKINDSREEASRTEERNSEEVKPVRRFSVVDRNFVQKERPKSLFPPLAKGPGKSSFQSLSEPSSPTAALEFKSASQHDLRNIDSVSNYKSVRSRKIDQGKSASFDDSTRRKGIRSRSDYPSDMFGCRTASRDGIVDKGFIPIQDRKTSGSNFEDALAMPKESFHFTRRVNKKNSCNDNKVSINGIACKKHGLPELMGKFGNPKYSKKYEEYKSEFKL